MKILVKSSDNSMHAYCLVCGCPTGNIARNPALDRPTMRCAPCQRCYVWCISWPDFYDGMYGQGLRYDASAQKCVAEITSEAVVGYIGGSDQKTHGRYRWFLVGVAETGTDPETEIDCTECGRIFHAI